ncbi:SETMR methyltransferase, partial [Acromyrmex heyeri]
VKVRELVEATGISHGTVISILHEQLDIEKLSAKWVPRLLTVDHKHDRVTISKQCLETFQPECNPDEFLRRFITVDETWIHYFTPKTKEQSKQWSAPKAKIVKLAGKVMATSDYAVLLDWFNNILKKKRPHLAKKKMLFHQNNARVYMCSAPMAKFNEFRYELLPHMKKWFGGKRFITREQFIAETEAYFEGLKSYHLNGLKKLENHWIKCIELKGDYVEK